MERNGKNNEKKNNEKGKEKKIKSKKNKKTPIGKYKLFSNIFLFQFFKLIHYK